MGAIFQSFISYVVCAIALALCSLAGFFIGKKMRESKNAKEANEAAVGQDK